MSAILTEPYFWALVGSLFGGVGLELIKKWLTHNTEIRATYQSYRDEIKDLNERLDKVEAEVDAWRDRHYHNEEYIMILKACLVGAGITPPDRPPQ